MVVSLGWIASWTHSTKRSLMRTWAKENIRPEWFQKFYLFCFIKEIFSMLQLIEWNLHGETEFLRVKISAMQTQNR
jgi:hypothetical protein